MKNTEEWKIPNEFLDKLTEPNAKFIFEHSEKLLKDLNDTANVIVARTANLISITVVILVALVGYSVNRIDSKNVFDAIACTSLIGVCYLFVLCILLLLNVRPTGYYGLGAEPKIFFCKNFFSEKNENDNDRTIYLYANEIESYQTRIIRNKKKNSRRWRLYGFSLWLLCSTPVILIIAYLIIHRRF